jgi:uncharacterized membrane protein
LNKLPSESVHEDASVRTDSRNTVCRPLIPGHLQFIFFVLALAIIFFVVFQTFYRVQSQDGTLFSSSGLYYEYASNIMNGQMPYRDFGLEYPPLSLLFFILPRLLADSWLFYSYFFQIEVLICACLGLWITYRIAQRTGQSPWKLMAPYTLAIVAIGPITGQQYDIFPAIMLLGSLYFFWQGKHKTSWVLMTLGVLTKLFPAVLAPLYLIIYLRERRFRTLAEGVISAALVCLVVLLPFLVTGPDNLMSLVTYHTARGLQVESTYSSFLLLGNSLGFNLAEMEFNYGSWNLNGTAAHILASFSSGFQLVVLLLCYWYIWTRLRPGRIQIAELNSFALLLISALLFTSKILSPQYIIWLLPVIALAATRWRFTVWGVFVAACLMTYFIFPVYYTELLNQNVVLIMILGLRNILLLLLGLLAVVSIQKLHNSSAGPS